jgi:hypothetical protein
MESHLRQPNNTSIAFVIGNGTSRNGINLNQLKNFGTVYGCNAQYRDYNPHYLIAVDVKMVNEIITSGYHLTNSVWTNPNKGVATKSNINFFNPHKGWSSGPTALWLSTKHNHKEIYILGFDYQGINGKFNNVYADTHNYKKSNDNQTYYGNWLSQTETIVKENTNIKFYRIVKEDSFIPDRLKSYSNFLHLNYNEFVEKYSKTIIL